MSRENDRPKLAGMEYGPFESLQEIKEDYFDHLHAESVLDKTSSEDWLDSETVKKALGISK